MDREEEAKLKPDDLDKKQIEEMSEEEVLMWYQVLAHQDEVQEKRRGLLKFVDMRDTDDPRIPPIHVESEVIE